MNITGNINDQLITKAKESDGRAGFTFDMVVIEHGRWSGQSLLSPASVLFNFMPSDV